MQREPSLANKEVNRAMTESVRDPSPSRDPASLVVGATAAQVIGGLVTQMLPLVIGWLIAGLSVSGRAVRRNHGGRLRRSPWS
jgi:hypothetical protein